MAGILDSLVAMLGQSDQGGAPVPPVDPWADLDAKKAAEEAAKQKPFGPFPGLLNAPYQMAGGNGMSPGPYNTLPDAPAPDLPPSTNDPMAREPDVFASGVPVPRPDPRSPATIDGVNAPLSLAPQSDDTTIPTNAAPAGPAVPGGDAGAPSGASGAPTGVPGFGGGIAEGLGGVLGKIFDPNRAATMLALGSGMAGAPSFGTGMRRAFAAAAPAVAADRANALKQESISQSYKALVARGVPAQEALAAVYNPDIMKATASKYFEAKPLQHVMMKDSLGNEIPLSYDQNKGIYYGADGKPYGSGGGAGGGMTAAAQLPPNYDPTTNRDETFLKALDPVTQAAVKDIADGKMPGTGRNLQKLMPLVARYENGFDNTTYQRRQALEKSYYGGGEGGKALRAANTTIDHGIQLQKAIDDLHNYSTLPGVLNPVTGAVSAQFDKKYQDALSRFNTNADLYSRELDFALTGKSTVSGQNHIRQMFDPYGSPVANKASLQQTLEMLNQRVGEHENTYRTGMDKPGGQVFQDMLTQRPALNKLLGQDTGAGNTPPAAPGAGQTGNGISWRVVQ